MAGVGILRNPDTHPRPLPGNRSHPESGTLHHRPRSATVRSAPQQRQLPNQFFIRRVRARLIPDRMKLTPARQAWVHRIGKRWQRTLPNGRCIKQRRPRNRRQFVRRCRAPAVQLSEVFPVSIAVGVNMSQFHLARAMTQAPTRKRGLSRQNGDMALYTARQRRRIFVRIVLRTQPQAREQSED